MPDPAASAPSPATPDAGDGGRVPRRLLTAFLWLGTLTLVFYLLVIGQALIIPLVLAFFTWYLIHTLTQLISRLRVGAWQPKGWMAFFLSAAVVIGLLLGLVSLILDNAVSVQQKLPEYIERFDEMADRVERWVPGLDGSGGAPSQAADNGDAATVTDPPRDDATLAGADGADLAPEAAAADPVATDPAASAAGGMSLRERIAGLDYSGPLRSVAATLISFASSAAMVLAYLFFIFLEQRFFSVKLGRLFPDERRRAEVRTIIQEIDRDIQAYIGVKTLVSLLTAGLSYVIMRVAGLDFAEFWAVLLFVFNFIPNIGSLIATALPAMLALVQLEFGWFLFVTIGILAVQLTMGNLVEPPMMGKSLNQSPLVVILALVLWGSLWGVAGMFLCVPITVVAMIILSHFPQTRWVPVMLSLDGRVRGDPDARRKAKRARKAPADAGTSPQAA